jgi:hypothetical protein
MTKKKILLVSIAALLSLTLMTGIAAAKRYVVGGKPLNLYGLFSQNVAMGWHDNYDTKEGINTAVFTALIEGDYQASDNFKLFGQFLLAGDWAYNINDSNNDWEMRRFDQSRSELSLDSEYWQIMKELHATWNPGNFMFRVGKQIISWGQTDGLRLMDQINPLDQRRGFSDVEFETTIIPIWLLRLDYFPPIYTESVSDLSLQFWFNPNADFIPTQGVELGNDMGGIWSPYFPAGANTLAGSTNAVIQEPDEWSEGHEFGFRVQGMIGYNLISLNYFYGWENDALLFVDPATTTFEANVLDGINLLHFGLNGYYPRQRFVGGTFSRDLQSLRKIMGKSPVLRAEAFYAFDNSFITAAGALEKHDEIRYSLGLDWKVDLDFLNPSAGTSFGAQFFNKHICDLDSAETLTATAITPVEDNNSSITLFISTSYLNAKLTPSVFWLRDLTNKAYFVKPAISYIYDRHWTFTAGCMFLAGDKVGSSFQLFEHKDYAFFKVAYKWG